jgi:hypothetical protein
VKSSEGLQILRRTRRPLRCSPRRSRPGISGFSPLRKPDLGEMIQFRLRAQTAAELGKRSGHKIRRRRGEIEVEHTLQPIIAPVVCLDRSPGNGAFQRCPCATVHHIGGIRGGTVGRRYDDFVRRISNLQIPRVGWGFKSPSPHQISNTFRDGRASPGCHLLSDYLCH